MHTLNGIRTHDPSVRTSENILYPRPRDLCDRRRDLTFILSIDLKVVKKNSGAFSPPTNYTDRGTAACRRS
jgi:hypothetical protein